LRNFVAFCLQMATDYRNTTGLGLRAIGAFTIIAELTRTRSVCTE